MPNTTTAQSLGLAICNVTALPNEQGVSERVLIIPDGEFTSRDGRPFDVPSRKWLMDDIAFANLQMSAATRTNDFLFDYEHQTLHKEKNGQPAPASGWFKTDALEYIPGEGVYAKNVAWTDAAHNALLAKEYRYVSPVFLYDKNTGRPLVLLHVALTNDPALTGLDEIAVLNAQFFTQPTGTSPMNEAQKLLAALGITVTGDVTTEHIAQGEAAIADLNQKVKAAESKDTQIAALTAQVKQGTQQVDLSKYVPVEAYNALFGQLAALNTEHQGMTIESTIDKAKQDGRVVASEVDYLSQLGKQQGLAALNTVLDSRSPIAALTTQQTNTQPKPDAKTGIAALSTEQKYAADQLGISYTDYAALLKEENQ
ncbi:phage protease [Pseudoalteromonas sp. T1lg65]|uniref:phage protease n=1 Tax=Pseudoalteromonas sp. T1lg65 TaxID=2077101 RepID=UPI003F7A86A9